MPKFVYDFTEGNKDLKDLLGGKGANLAEMTRLGLPVPPGFTISTEACRAYLFSLLAQTSRIFLLAQTSRIFPLAEPAGSPVAVFRPLLCRFPFVRGRLPGGPVHQVPGGPGRVRTTELNPREGAFSAQVSL